MSLYFYLSVAVLALLLFFPVSKLIWVLSVRRMQKKLDRPLLDNELHGQKFRASVIALLVSLAFAWIFNLRLLGGASHG